ncbi:MAG: DUF971 domain-containing protein, partial [Planctomycetota bacterium]|nr:DUF971 domain-containing protein [Planctomycetota bacterium]
MEQPPIHLDLRKDRGLTIQWQDGTTAFLSIPLLRRMSPSADMRQLRDEMENNPLTVLPNRPMGGSGALTALGAELAGNYGLKIAFSDGHATGIYTWQYLRELAA